ncbi:hypothetical protein MNBD_GAMMA12-158 [hydrothermal vent metagenome]|uniref:Tetratricopeptide repeat protein n=1 Tax=hydrothermal vent metagenome TaxID=652676 RepID=A0A3B0Y188_9ZZZZ
MCINKICRQAVMLGTSFAFLLLLSACSGSSSIKSSGTPVTELETPAVPARAIPSPRAVRGRQTAVQHLIRSAQQKAQAGQFVTAAELLERGLRIDPYNAKLWGSLAGIRLKQKQFQLSESLAHKSNSFAEGDQVLKLKNWGLIAESRKLRGDKAGADAALQKVSGLMK